MLYIKISDGQVKEYPYSLEKLRDENPNVSFPQTPDENTLQSYGVCKVVGVNRPTVGYAKNVSEALPEFVDGQWVQSWEVTDATSEEIALRLKSLSDKVRSKRDALLSDSDWVVIKSVEGATQVPSAWATYRQELRDITNQTGFPAEVVWPTKP